MRGFVRVGTVLLAAAAVGAGCAGGGAVGKEVLVPRPETALAAYSPAVRAGDLVFLSGVIGTRPGTRELAAGGAAGQTRQAIENMRAVLHAAGLDLPDLVKCTVFLADMADYGAMNEVYGEFFRVDPPARSAVGTGGLPLGAAVEIECIAAARVR
jgi:2-iminobutanoate/2-iminopropanoate deaminase